VSEASRAVSTSRVLRAISTRNFKRRIQFGKKSSALKAGLFSGGVSWARRLTAPGPSPRGSPRRPWPARQIP
jgi:hypothetical protein